MRLAKRLTLGVDLGGGGGGGDPGGEAPGVHRYWRLYITANDGSASFIGTTELQLLDASAVNVSGGGLSSSYASSSDINASNSFEDAFDGNIVDSGWLTATATPPAWLKVDLSGAGLAGPAEIKSFRIYGSHNAPTASPKDFSLQWSDDNAAWTDALVVTGETGWAANELRTFEVF